MLGITALSQSPIASLGGTNVNVAVTGQQLNTALGAETIKADANVNLTGIQLTSVIANVDIALNTPVNITANTTALQATFTVTNNGTTVIYDDEADGLLFDSGPFSVSFETSE